MNIKTDSKWMFLTNDRFMTISGHFFATCVFIFLKTEVQRCLTGLNSDWFKGYDTKCKNGQKYLNTYKNIEGSQKIWT